MDKKLPILVTGGTGYLASWVIKELLEADYTVNTTVRNLGSIDKLQHLKKWQDEYPEKLHLFEADLLKDNSFNEAMKNCQAVVHTASPFFINNIKNAQKELIEPAVKGTQNVLESVNRTESVKRVVLTSSVAAIFGDSIDIRKTEKNIFTEEHWNTSSTEKHNPYSLSKTLAEKKAWTMVENQSRWTLSTINPGFIMGPSLTKRKDSTSINFLIRLADGTYKTGAPELYFGVVDVRDVAFAHIKALETTHQERHILVADTIKMIDFANILSEEFGEKYKFPKKNIPIWLIFLIGPAFGLSRRFVRFNMGIPIYFDNKRSKTALGIKYYPINQTIIEHFQQIMDDNLIG